MFKIKSITMEEDACKFREILIEDQGLTFVCTNIRKPNIIINVNI